MIRDWITERSEMQLHVYQLKTIIKIFKKLYKDFELQGVLDVRNNFFNEVHKRLTVCSKLDVNSNRTSVHVIRQHEE